MTPIIWTPSAIRDLEGIEAYVAQYRPVAARRLVQKIVKRTERLARFPLSGGYVEEDERRRYRQVLQGNYRVIYRYDPETNVMQVITVIHAARLLDPDRMGDVDS
jgi:toxin ParE1/3/4